MPGSKRQADVVIVGGGLSGLSAAKHLIERDPSLKLTIVEATDFAGGRLRTKTVKLPGVGPIRADLGGQWVGAKDKRLMKLCKELGVELYPQFDTGKKIMDTGCDRPLKQFSGTIPPISVWGLLELQLFVIWRIDWLSMQVDMAMPSQHPLREYYDNMTVEGWIERNVWAEDARVTIRTACLTIFGCTTREISMLYFLLYIQAGHGIMCLCEIKDGAQHFRIHNGALTIIDNLRERLSSMGDVEFVPNSPVTGVTQEEDGEGSFTVVVTTSGGHKPANISAKRVIMACPPLCHKDMEWSPKLPSWRKDLESNLYMGSYTKCVVYYKSLFWRDQGYSGEVLSLGLTVENPVCYIVDTSGRDDEHPGLCCFMSAEIARAYNDDDDREAAVIRALVRYFGPLASDYIGYESIAWDKEQWAGGCPVNLFGAGKTVNQLDIMREPIGAVHFAATDTAREGTGYMEGAIESGHRAADEVIASFASPSETLTAVQKLVEQDPLSIASRGPVRYRTSLTQRIALYLPDPHYFAIFSLGALVLYLLRVFG